MKNEPVWSNSLEPNLKELIPAGTVTKCISINDPDCTVSKWANGIVDFVDDVGVIRVTWQDGQTRGLAPGSDSFVALVKGLVPYIFIRL